MFKLLKLAFSLQSSLLPYRKLPTLIYNAIIEQLSPFAVERMFFNCSYVITSCDISKVNNYAGERKIHEIYTFVQHDGCFPVTDSVI